MFDETDSTKTAPGHDADQGLEADLAVAALAVLAIEIAGRLAFHASGGAGNGWAAGSPYPAALGKVTGMVFVIALRLVQTSAALAYVCALRRRKPSSLGLGAKGTASGVVAGLVFCAMLAAGLAAWAAAARSFDWIPPAQTVLGSPPFEAGDSPLFVLGVIAMIVAGPLAEEIVFRGLIFGAVRKPFGEIAATAVSSCLFAASHAGGPWPVYLAGGAAFAVLRARTGSLAGPLVAHAAGNAIIIFHVF